MKPVGLTFKLFLFMCLLAACSVSPSTPNPQITANIPPVQTAILATEPSPAQLTVTPEATSDAMQVNATPTSAPPDEMKLNQPVGEVRFQDKLAEADQVIFVAQNLPALSNQVYQAWFSARDGSVTNAGLLAQQPDGSASVEYTSPDGRPVMVNASHFFITQEDAEQTAPGPQVVLTGDLQPDLQQIARNFFEVNQGEPATPRNKPFAQGMNEQFSLAMQHIDNAINAQAIGASAETRQHLEHVINILEGAQGERFKDYTGDQVAQNPGDGFGVVQYIRQTAIFIHNPNLDAAANEVVNAIIAIENNAIAILEQQNGAPTLADLKTQAVELSIGPMQAYYQLIQQSFTVKLTSTP